MTSATHPVRRFLSPPVPLRENQLDPDRPSLALRAFVARKAKQLAFRLTASNRSSPIRSVRRARTVVSKPSPAHSARAFFARNDSQDRFVRLCRTTHHPLGGASPAAGFRRPRNGSAGPLPLQNDSGSVPVGRDEVIMREVGRVGTKPAKKYLSMMYFNGLVWFAVWIDCGQPVSPARKVVT